KLCADLESYGKIGASQLSATLESANLSDLGNTVGAVARDIRDKSQMKWSQQTRRSALRDLDEAIGQLSGTTSFLTDFHHGQPSPAGNLVRWSQKVSLKSAAIGSSLLLGAAAKAASYFPGTTGERTADYLEGMKENVAETLNNVVDKIDPTDIA